ncbi:hypothetical protein F9C11_21365 [Amycolatopsis sp. VS8301801F10]|uniref:hypothetical protein n=1 Tax=unclassified Amycolatopsis TaxID=2618356 RepID=UPI0038FCB47A
MPIDHLETDYVRIPRPRSIARMLLDFLRVRADVAARAIRGETIVSVTETLSASGCSGRIASREPGGEWSVTVVPAAAGGLPEAR